jgi:hypothetical protein
MVDERDLHPQRLRPHLSQPLPEPELQGARAGSRQAEAHIPVRHCLPTGLTWLGLAQRWLMLDIGLLLHAELQRAW